MGEKAVLEVNHLSKNFGSNKVLKSLDLKVLAGEIYALIGQNGVGKTTLIRSIVGLTKPEVGKVFVNSVDIYEDESFKQFLGYVPDGPSGYDYLTGEEFLYLSANVKRASRAEVTAAMKIFGTDSFWKQRMINYSRGNLQKAAFGAALIGSPKLLVIDEPVVGLDPISVERFGKKLQEFAKAGGAVLFVTHMLEFAKKYATKYGLLQAGKIVEEKEMTKKTALRKLFRELTQNV